MDLQLCYNASEDTFPLPLPQEVEGVLNPAAARGPDGELYLFPRLVAQGNYSRIGIARVRFNEAGDPAGVERFGIALQPEADYELRPTPPILTRHGWLIVYHGVGDRFRDSEP